MKWILICVAAFAICFGIGFIISLLVIRKKANKRILKRIVITITSGLVLSITCTFAYLGIYSKPQQDAMNALKGNNDVKVNTVNGGYFFDGPGNDTALIFYPGAKVKCEAYAPLMLRISSNGIDCFLTDMPFNFALFGENKCELFLNSYKYDNWIMSGHSMGGMVAANYTSKHVDKINGLVLLASYPGNPISDNVSLLSIYGTLDGCLEKDTYNKDKVNWPKNSLEYIIEGANHAQFGDYGNQSGDKTASISKEEQWDLTANKITQWSRN